jgi:hypothetical protein
VETRTAGSESGLGKRTDGNTGTAPQADSTTMRGISLRHRQRGRRSGNTVSAPCGSGTAASDCHLHRSTGKWRTPRYQIQGRCDVVLTNRAAPDALNRIGLATLTASCGPDRREATALSPLRFRGVGLSWLICRSNQGRTRAAPARTKSVLGWPVNRCKSFAGGGSRPLGCPVRRKQLMSATRPPRSRR